ncbi:MAG: ABC transporter permease subunit [Kiritimatiellaeota bacterium]|nr:ABC transporter permease subunit [Kiritimatiellota bacterium]
MLSPLTRKRLQNFTRIRRARWALILLCALFGISLVSELLCNSRPLWMRVNGKTYFPFIQRLTLRDLEGDAADASRMNYHAFTASEAFTADPRNKALWAPVRYSPGDVIDSASLREHRTVSVSVVPEVSLGRLNLLPDGTIILPLSCEPFFPGAETVEGLRLDAHWKLTDAVQAEIRNRLAGRGGHAFRAVAEHTTDPGLRARITMPEVRPSATPPASVRISFSQTDAPERPFQLRFRQSAEVNAAPLETRRWGAVPDGVREEIARLAQEGFKGQAPSAVIGWKGRTAKVSCALNEISWPFHPVKGHWMGIDGAGRDVLSRVLYGMRIALIFGLLLAFWAMAFGAVMGAVQGFFGGAVDIAGQRLTEIWSALPFLYVMIFIGSALGRGFLILLVCYSLFNWIGISSYMRAEFLRLRTRTFVDAARSQGLSDARIIFSHILPNALTPLITLFPFSLMGAIGSLAALDFLGFGLPPLTPSWGELLQQAQMFRSAWWLILFPSAALFTVMLLTVLVGEGLRDAFDPRQQSKME